MSFSLSVFQLSHHPPVPEEHLGHLYNEPSSANPGYLYNTWIHSSYLPPNPNHMKLVIGSISQPSVSQSNHDQVHVQGRAPRAIIDTERSAAAKQCFECVLQDRNKYLFIYLNIGLWLTI